MVDELVRLLLDNLYVQEKMAIETDHKKQETFSKWLLSEKSFHILSYKRYVDDLSQTFGLEYLYLQHGYIIIQKTW